MAADQDLSSHSKRYCPIFSSKKIVIEKSTLPVRTAEKEKKS